MAHTFNSSTRELETRKDMAGQRKEYKEGEDRSADAVREYKSKDRVALLV